MAESVEKSKFVESITFETMLQIVNSKLDLFPNCAARTVVADIEPIARVSQKVGIAIEAATSCPPTLRCWPDFDFRASHSRSSC